MQNEDRVIQRPANPGRLVLLFHGVGSHGDNMAALGELIGRSFPDDAVVTVCATEDFDQGVGGKQWFSVAGVTEENRMMRVADSMPDFVLRIHTYQRMFGLSAERTILIGFSQGAIMSLHSVFYEPHVAAQVVALSGRMACLPEMAVSPPHSLRFDFIHGALDAVIFPAFSNAAAAQLKSLGYPVSSALVPGMGHEINHDVVRLLLDALKW